jgi:dihydropyrimidine dehydrogenase (NAD+) subunit PreA
MARLDVTFAKIRSPNPFWIASAPPSNTGEQIQRAFDQGWGGVSWKTLSDPIVNVSSRLAGLDYGQRRLAGMSNIELSTDRSLEVNLKEIVEVKRRYPDHAVVVSLMMARDRQAWVDLARRAEDTGCDGLELNYGCPHGMPERGMGAAIGQVAEYTREITSWVREAVRAPLLVKLTPMVADVGHIARAARDGGADGIVLINSVASILGIDLETFSPLPTVADRAAHAAGYTGPSVKPIALYQVARAATSGAGLPISGIGGIETWRDAAEFILLGATTVQVCTAIMHHGYRIVRDLCDGLSGYLDRKGLDGVDALRGRSLERMGAWEELDLNYKVVARIDPAKCIGCGVCHVACMDGGHQAIAATRVDDGTEVKILEEKCVGCNLCSLVCPVEGCIRMVEPGPRLAPRSWREVQGGAGQG